MSLPVWRERQGEREREGERDRGERQGESDQPLDT